MSAHQNPEPTFSSIDKLSLQPLGEVVSMQVHRTHNILKLEISNYLVVVTASQQWAYALSFPLRKPADFAGSRVLIRVAGWVNSGRVGVGVVRTDGSTYVQEVFRTPYDGLTCFDLLTDSLEDCWAVVVRNAAGEGMASKITLESIQAYLCLSEPTILPVTVRWTENRQAIVPGPETCDSVTPPPRSDVPPAQLKTRGRFGNESGRPAVSLILTVKNGMPYLPQALESLRQQRCKDFELVVQDCLSTDGSLECLENLEGLRVTVESARDSGIGDAWKRAFAHCRGEVIGSIDSDNLLKPDALSTVVAIFQEHPEAAALYGGVEMINENGSTNSYFLPDTFDLLQLLSCELVPPWSTAFFSRGVCGPNLLFNESLRVCTDFDVWLRISHLPILQTDKVLGSTRLSNKSMTCRPESYDQFCQAKIQALGNYLDRLPHRSLATALSRFGIAGIYCWAAESVQRLGANRQEIEKYVDMALKACPTSIRAKRMQATL